MNSKTHIVTQNGSLVIMSWKIRHFGKDGFEIADGEGDRLAAVFDPSTRDIWLTLLTNGDDFVPGADMPDDWRALAEIVGDGDVREGNKIISDFLDRVENAVDERFEDCIDFMRGQLADADEENAD